MIPLAVRESQYWSLCLSSLLVLSTVLGSFPASAADATSTWDGSTNNWTSNHWSSPNFPNNGNGGLTYDAVLGSGTVTVDQDISIQKLTLTGGTLTATSPFLLTINDLLDWSFGTMSGAGQTVIGSGAALSITGVTRGLNCALVNNGAANWTSGQIPMTSGTFQNNGSFIANSASTLSSFGFGGTNVFNNAGSFTKQGVGTTQFFNNVTGVPFNNSGTVDVQAGTLAFSSGGTQAGDFSGLTGATLQFGGDHTFALGSDITGGLNVQFASGTITDNGLINTTSAVTFQGGNAAINGGITASSLHITVVGVPVTATLNGPIAVPAGGTISGGTLDGSANWNITGTLAWSGGAMQGTGQTVIAPGGILSVNGGALNSALNRSLINNGTASWTSGGIPMTNGTFQNNGSFIANSASTLSSFGVAGSNAFINAGSFTKQGGGTTQFFTNNTGVTFNNTGTVDVQAGTLQLLTGVTQYVGNQLTSGTWRIGTNATLNFPSGSSITTSFANVTLDGTSSTFAKINSLVDNRGSFSILNGRNFTAAGVFSNTGAVTIGIGSTFTAPGVTQFAGNQLTGGVWHLGSNATLSVASGTGITTNFGDVSLDNGATFAQINSLDDNRGSFSILNGRNFTVTVVDSFSNTGIVMIGTGSTFTTNALTQQVGSQLTAGTWHIGNNGTLNVTGGANVTTNLGDVSLDIGANFAQINSLVDNRGSFAILNGRNFNAGGSFSNAGTVTVGTGSTFTAPAVTQIAGGQLTGGAWHLGTSATLDIQGGSNIAINSGDVSLDAGSSFTKINSLLDNRGSFAIQGGRNFSATGAFSNSGLVTIGAGSTFTTTSGFNQAATGKLSGTGTLAGNFQNAGRLAPGNSPGIITINGNYTQAADGVLEIEVGGLTPGNGPNYHDQVIVSGTAALDGRLEVPLVNGFVPALNNEITFLTAGGGPGAVTGSFSSIYSPNLGSVAGLAVKVLYSGTDVKLRFVMPENNIAFAATSQTADWSVPSTWTTSTVPGSTNNITVNNLIDSVPQRVDVQSLPAFVNNLTVADNANTITVGVQSGYSLSAIDATTVGNLGIIELNGGRLVSNLIEVQGGGELSGSGTAVGNVVVGAAGGGSSAVLSPGTIASPIGHIDFAGPYQQTATGTLAIDIHGAAAGQFDTISVTGQAKLGGTLEIDATGLAPPTPGTVPTFPILTAGSLSADPNDVFSSVETVGNPGIYFAAIYSLGSGAGAGAGALAGGASSTAGAGAAAGEYFVGDMNRDGYVNASDIDLFTQALANRKAYYNSKQANNACICISGDISGDVNGNGRLDFGDIRTFAMMVSGSGSASYTEVLARIEFDLRNVPEPSTTVLLLCGIGMLLVGGMRGMGSTTNGASATLSISGGTGIPKWPLVCQVDLYERKQRRT
jgi:hypothetical protein